MKIALVGRIAELNHPWEPMPVCARCLMLETAIREHQRAKEAGRSFVDDATADLELWRILGL